MARIDPNAPVRKRRLKDWMLKHGWTAADFAKGGEFHGFGFGMLVGRPARRAIRAMQEKARLPVTGKFDRVTLDKLFPGRIRRRFRRAMAAGYKKYSGVREVPLGSNRGPMVDKFLAHVGFAPGAAWCCAMMWYVADTVAHYNGPVQTGSRAYVPHLENWAQKMGIIVPRAKGLRGMTVTWKYSGKRQVGAGDHVGVLMANLGVAAFVMEGGGNEGDRVKISLHPVWQVNTVIDLARLQKP